MSPSVIAITETAAVHSNGIHAKKRAFDVQQIPHENGNRIKRAKQNHENGSTRIGEQTPTSNGTSTDYHRENSAQGPVPDKQNALLLHAIRKPYEISEGTVIPEIRLEADEVLIKVQTIGLNPIDWKAPDYGFGIPELPYIAGRDLVGVIVSEPSQDTAQSTRSLRKGDIVSSASTDYRDLRKSAFQQYAVASRSNICRIPVNVQKERTAGLGVAFVAAVLSVGVCFGTDFSALDEPLKGPNLKQILASTHEHIPQDVREESLNGIKLSETPQRGDWVAIWGGSSATAILAAQLCKLLGLRVIKIVDVAKHGDFLSQGPADILIDSHNTERAIEIIRRVTGGTLRFAIDTIGKTTSETLRKALHSHSDAVTVVNPRAGLRQSHLVGLSGLPKSMVPGIKHHAVPIKVHHEIPEVGEALMQWLEKLLKAEAIVPPRLELVYGGLQNVNASLDRMRKGEISGKRLAVSLEV